jgi:hypothetical protein
MVSAPGGFIVKEISKFAGSEVGGFPVSVQLNPTMDAVAAELGVPVTIPVLTLSVRPAGRDPDLTDQVKGGVPPCVKVIRFKEKGCPGVAGGGCTGGGMTGANVGLTVTETDWDRPRSLTDVAVTVAVSAALTFVGAT